MYVPRAMYSLSTSFWIVPVRSCGSMPCRSAAATTISSSMAAGALIVIETLTLSSGMPASRSSMSCSVSIATPVRPTSPSASGSSES